ncbi:hypothetical protein SprV_0100163400 [Sparganum proliferum]
MHFQSRVSIITIHKLLFVDDYAVNATTEVDVQRNMDLFAATCDNFGPIINTEKTVVMHQSPPDAAYLVPQINVNGAQLQAVVIFTSLGSIPPAAPKSTTRWPARFQHLVKPSVACRTPSVVDMASTSAPK